MRYLALASIRFYQKFISPYKGFGCAYRIHTGCASCSALGYRAVRRHGVVTGFFILRERTYKCGVAHRRYSVQPRRAIRSQRGDCDLGCDSPADCQLDLPCGSFLSRFFDSISCTDFCDCDWPDRKRKDTKDEELVYIPTKDKSHSE